MGKLKRDITATFTGNVAGTLLLFAVAVILARVLGPAGRGLLGLALLIPDVASKIFSFGHETVNSTFPGLYKDKRPSLFLQTFIVTVLGSLISVLAICAFYFWLPVNKGRFGELSTDVILLSCLVVPSTMLVSLLIEFTRGVGKVTSAAVVYTVYRVVLFSLILIVLVFYGGGIKQAVLIHALSPLAAIALAIWMLSEYATFRPGEFSLSLFKKSFAFGGQIGLSTIAMLLNYRLDQAILAFMVPIEQIGLYLIAVGCAERLRVLPISIATAFMPHLANDISGQQPQVPRVYRYTMIISLVFMVIIAIVGAPVIVLVFGADYAGSIAPLLWLLPGIVVLGGSSILSSDLAVREVPKYSVIIGYSAVIVNLILNLLLIPKYGIIGAAIASTISYAFAGCMWIVFYRRESKTPLIELVPRLEDVKYLLKHLAFKKYFKEIVGIEDADG